MVIVLSEANPLADPCYGALSFIGQYAYLLRDPWSIAPIGRRASAVLTPEPNSFDPLTNS
jgi:hypothetical protein